MFAELCRLAQQHQNSNILLVYLFIFEGHAPFLSKTSRFPAFGESSETYPGPGQYDCTPVKVTDKHSLTHTHTNPCGRCQDTFMWFLQPNVRGGCSLRSRCKRFEEVVSEVPGPGAYDVLPSLETTPEAPEKPGRRMVSTQMKLGVLRV